MTTLPDKPKLFEVFEDEDAYLLDLPPPDVLYTYGKDGKLNTRRSNITRDEYYSNANYPGYEGL